MRHLLLVPAVLLTGCDLMEDGNWGNHDRFKAEYHQTYALKAGNRVSVENTNGSIEVTGWDQETVDVSAVRSASSQDLLDQVKVDVTASGEAVRIRTIKPASSSGWRNGGWAVKYVIKVPRRTELDRVESTNGALRLASIGGPVRLHTTNGSIKLDSIEGAVKAETTNGAIHGDALRGAVEAESTNGSVHLNLGALADSNAIRVATTNGSVELGVEKLAGNPIRCETTNGSVTLRLPADVKARVKARTSHSTVKSDFDIAGDFDSKRRSVDGTINGGGALIEASTTNGSIRIEKR